MKFTILLLTIPLCLAAGVSPANPIQLALDAAPLPPVFPWLASVLIDDFFYCEGYLISAKHILITANYVLGGSYFTILLGGGDTEVSTELSWVHPGYNDTTFGDNIALLELSDPVEYTENIQAAALSDVGQVVEEGDLLTVCLYESFDSMVCLENIPVLSEEECAALFPGLSSIFCLLSSSETCLGKSAVIHAGEEDERLVGVASLSSSLGCLFEEPVFFTMTESYLDWIREHTQSLSNDL